MIDIFKNHLHLRLLSIGGKIFNFKTQLQVEVNIFLVESIFSRVP